jgi:CubicO group peptidase (beta-lactamase class C family)
MGKRIGRRQFLIESGRVALGASVLTVACARERQPAGGSEGPEPWSTLTADLEKQTPALMASANVAGLAIAIIRDGQLFWRRGFGVKDKTTNQPVDNETVFEAASTSKPVFAYAVMKLCERGVMDLDTPLTTYTSERFIRNDPRLDLITARHVLSHTGGLHNWRSKNDPLAIHSKPGEQWAYSGEGYSYLQSVVTRLVGGRVNVEDCGAFEEGVKVCSSEPSIDDYLRANMLVPFGMSSSGYLWNASIESHMAPGHDEKGMPTGLKRKPDGPSLARYGMAGGLCTTPTDYAKFLMEIINPKPSDQFRLTQASLEEMLRPQIRRNESSSWALGWEINHTPDGDFIRHGGGNPGYACFVAGSVERKSGYVIMTNGENSGYSGVIAPLISGDTLSRFLGGKLRSASE